MKLASHRLFTSILAAGALFLGACVAETADEEAAPVGTATEADGYTPTLPKDTGGVKPSSGTPAPGRSRAKPSSGDNLVGKQADPEPSPWRGGDSGH